MKKYKYHSPSSPGVKLMPPSPHHTPLNHPGPPPAPPRETDLAVETRAHNLSLPCFSYFFSSSSSFSSSFFFFFFFFLCLLLLFLILNFSITIKPAIPITQHPYIVSRAPSCLFDVITPLVFFKIFALRSRATHPPSSNHPLTSIFHVLPLSYLRRRNLSLLYSNSLLTPNSLLSLSAQSTNLR